MAEVKRFLKALWSLLGTQALLAGLLAFPIQQLWGEVMVDLGLPPLSYGQAFYLYWLCQVLFTTQSRVHDILNRAGRS